MSATFPSGTNIVCSVSSTPLLSGEVKYRGSKFTFSEKKHITKFKFCMTSNLGATIDYRYLILDDTRHIIYYSQIYYGVSVPTSCTACNIENTANINLDAGTYYVGIAYIGSGNAGMSYQFISAGAQAGISGSTTTYDLSTIVTSTTLQLTTAESYYPIWLEAETYTEPPPPQTYVCEDTPSDSLELGDLATVASITLTTGTVQIRGNKVDFATKTKISKIRYYIGADVAFNINVRAILYTYNLIPIIASPIYNINLNYSTFIPEAWKEIDVDWLVEAGTYCIAIAMEGAGTAKLRYRNVGSGSGISTGVPLSLESLAIYILTTGISQNWYSVNSISCDAIEYVEPPPIEPPVEPPITPPTATGNMLLLAFVFVFIILMLIVLLLGDR